MDGNWVIILGVAGLGAATLFCLCARLWWVFDLATHFRQQYLLAAVLFGGSALAAGQWVWAVLAGLTVTRNRMVMIRVGSATA